MKLPIYLDYNASTPIALEVVEAMRPFCEKHFGNPSSSHAYGAQPRAAVERARGQVAALLGCQPTEIIFTSGGTESNNHALRGVAFARASDGNHLVTSQVEHPAVLEVCHFLEGQGFQVTYLPVEPDGRVSLAAVERAITKKTILISIMHANNEVGAIQPLREIGRIAKKRGIVFHTDAAQSVGKISARVDDLGVDLLTVAGHKLYAPKGVGALYVRSGTFLQKLMHGANHEQSRRAGTENVMGIVGLGAACRLAGIGLEARAHLLKNLREKLFLGLQAKIGELSRHGSTTHVLPNTLSVGFPEVEAQALLSQLKNRLAASPGAACHSSGTSVSHVLEAMGVPVSLARSTVRFSLGRETTAKEIDQAILAISQTHKKIKTKGKPR